MDKKKKKITEKMIKEMADEFGVPIEIMRERLVQEGFIVNN